jgi:hypothetical protein
MDFEPSPFSDLKRPIVLLGRFQDWCSTFSAGGFLQPGMPLELKGIVRHKFGSRHQASPFLLNTTYLSFLFLLPVVLTSTMRSVQWQWKWQRAASSRPQTADRRPQAVDSQEQTATSKQQTGSDKRQANGKQWEWIVNAQANNLGGVRSKPFTIQVAS